MSNLIITQALVLVLTTTLAWAEPLPFEGKWALRLELCGAPDGAVTITPDRLGSAMMNCQFRSVLPGGMSYRVQAACEGAGERGDEFFTFALLSDRLHWTWAGKTGVFQRCP